MEDNKPKNNNEIQVELSEEMAQGTYANLAVISHSASEFILDFIRVVPGAPKAQVKSRVILTPDNAHRLYLALQDNLKKFEEMMASGRVVNAENGKTANFQDFVPKGDA
ncbi:MAG TPA: DUF3467 domain-containing protein [Candidatus Parabacteroides intestinavium]|nr:DUF3467 domain-containing protein [Candidatus Parabacteroides intestinavium]